MQDLLCVAELSRSVFYYWNSQTVVIDRYAGIKRLIQQLYDRHKGRYGYRRITMSLRKRGYVINHITVQKLMNQLGLKSTVRPKRYQSYRGAAGRIAPNLLAREFYAVAPNEKWVTDVTEFRVNGEKVYLSPMIDLYNSEVIAYQIQSQPTYDLVGKMLGRALRRLAPTQAPLIHSDQGWQYQLPAFKRVLNERGLKQSMSRKGNCLDNALMENFFGILKTEFFHRKTFASVDSFIQELKAYIRYYNYDRIKLKLKGLSPVQYRIQSLNLNPIG